MNFELSEKEHQDAKDWMELFRTIDPSKKWQFSYRFTPTGIGNVVLIEEKLTGTSKDITDTDSW